MIKFLWAECVRGSEIHRCLRAQYDDWVLPQWTDMFKSCRTRVTNEGSGLPYTSTTETNTEQNHALFLHSRRMAVDDVADKLQLISTYEIMYAIANPEGTKEYCPL